MKLNRALAPEAVEYARLPPDALLLETTCHVPL
jgi:hypothetical protein